MRKETKIYTRELNHEKWQMAGLGQELDHRSLEYLVISESKDVIKDSWGHVKS